MKKGVCFLLAILLCCSVTACNKTAEQSGISVITSNFPLYDFVREIGGEAVNVTMLLKPGVESHSFEPTPKDIIAIEKADLFLYMGGESEAWVKNLTKVDAVAMIDLIESKKEHSHHDHGADEHLWTSPKNAMKIAEMICNELSRIDPENKKIYEENLKGYLAELTDLDEYVSKIVKNGERKKIVFGDRFPFLYLAEEYGFPYEAAFTGCTSDTDASAATLSALIDTVKTKEIDTVFYLENSSQKIADAICRATGAESAMLHSCNNVTREEFESGKHFQTFMEENLAAMREALN